MSRKDLNMVTDESMALRLWTQMTFLDLFHTLSLT